MLLVSHRGCQTQEKVVAASAHTFVVIADDSKQSSYLGEKVNVAAQQDLVHVPLPSMDGSGVAGYAV